MQVESNRSRISSQVEFEFTDKPITPFGGMAVLIGYLH